MPKQTQTRKGSESSSVLGAGSDEELQSNFTLRVLEMLGDKEVVDKLRTALFPSELAEELRGLLTQITRLNETIESKDKVIDDLKARVVKLEDSLDDTEQYSRRANLRIQGIPDPGAGEDSCAKVLDVINNAMNLQPPLSSNDIERSHRLGRQTDPARPRTMIVRFRSERTRDSVYQSRSALKTRNQDVQPALRLFVNEDLTQRRSLMAYQTRKLRAQKKLSDCWTHNGHIIVKDNNNTITRIYSPQDLDKY